MNRRHLLGTLGFAAIPSPAPGRGQFIGVWKLISATRKLGDGRVDYPYGEAPVGRITYDKAGRMSAQLMRTGRRSTVPSGVSLIAGKAGCDEIREAVDGYISYFGTYDVDEANATVIHHVQSCLVPSWVGTDLKRAYRFDGNRLRLTATGPGVLEILWEREPD
jgi:catechol 1,2-dioxygenase